MHSKQLFKLVKSISSEKDKIFIEEDEEGAFTILDVRQPAEHEAAHIPGAKLIPLPELHNKAKALVADRPIIVYCAIGGRSRVAAQLLSGLGFKKVYNLKGGIRAWQGLKATGPKELNLDLVRGDETPDEIAALAYDMEDCLQTFYQEMYERVEDHEVRELFFKLASIEEKHKRAILKLSTQIEAPRNGLERIKTDTGLIILAGGFDMAGFMEQNAPILKTVLIVIEVAMMLETQALDLYLRFVGISTNAKTKDVLSKIAQEEKAHLALLGLLLEEKI